MGGKSSLLLPLQQKMWSWGVKGSKMTGSPNDRLRKTMQPIATTDDLVTFEAFCDLVEDGQKADLIDGVIYMASPDSKKANSLNLFLGNLLDGYIAAKDIDGDVFISRYACRINAVRAPEPDVGYVRPERKHLLHETFMDGGPDIAVEIVARDSRTRDYHEKYDLYKAAGVPEY